VVEPPWNQAFVDKYGEALPVNDLGGICVLKATDSDQCEETYGLHDRDQIRIERCSVVRVFVDLVDDAWRYVGQSDAQPVRESVCIPIQETVRSCG
jgi:hypothetical protein